MQLTTIKIGWIIASCGAALLVSGCDVQKPLSDPGASVTGVQIADFGLYDLWQTGDLKATGASGGYVHGTSAEKLIASTDHVPAAIGTNFGLHFQISGSPSDVLVHGTLRLMHPEFKNPATGESRTVEEWPLVEKVGQLHFSGWTFEKEWELAPGKWTIQVIYQGAVLAQKDFIVEKS